MHSFSVHTVTDSHSLEWNVVVVLIAQMGGYLARKHDSSLGPKAMWQGLTQLYHIIKAHKLLSKIQSYG